MSRWWFLNTLLREISVLVSQVCEANQHRRTPFPATGMLWEVLRSPPNTPTGRREKVIKAVTGALGTERQSLLQPRRSTSAARWESTARSPFRSRASGAYTAELKLLLRRRALLKVLMIYFQCCQSNTLCYIPLSFFQTTFKKEQVKDTFSTCKKKPLSSLKSDSKCECKAVQAEP